MTMTWPSADRATTPKPGTLTLKTRPLGSKPGSPPDGSPGQVLLQRPVFQHLVTDREMLLHIARPARWATTYP